MSSLSITANQQEELNTVPQATYAGAKRRIAALELQLQNVQEAGSKRKSYVIPSHCFPA